MDKEVELGHILGLFDTEPINIVPKPSDGKKKKWHLIYDLAYPYVSGQSVYSCIPDENYSAQYHYINEVIELALNLGEGILGACVICKNSTVW